MIKKVNYSAIVLDEESRTKLIQSIDIPIGWKLIAHHMTLTLGELPPSWKSKIGEEVVLTGNFCGMNDKALAFKIDNYKRLMPGQEHITIAINEANNGKPKDSNSITDWNIKIPELKLTGVIKEIVDY